MRTENEAKLEKIKTMSSLLWQFTGLILVFGPFCVVVENLIILASGDTSISFFDTTYPIAGAPFRSHMALIVLLDLLAGIGLKRVYHLFKLFGNYATGEVFSKESARQIRQLGITSVMGAGLIVLSVFVPPTILAHSPHAIRLSLVGVFDGGVIIAISWIMEMAAEFREENELTV